MRSGLSVTLNGQSIGALGSGSDPSINARLINTDAIRYNTDKGCGSNAHSSSMRTSFTAARTL